MKTKRYFTIVEIECHKDTSQGSAVYDLLHWLQDFGHTSTKYNFDLKTVSRLPSRVKPLRYIINHSNLETPPNASN